MSKHVKDKISLYIDGRLKDAELKAFELHVKTCGECAGLLADTKRAVNKVKNVREEQLPVNFYAKLNQKLDAIDAKKDTFSWVVFTRSAVAVFTMLIVGIFIYNLKNQTNNFSNMRMKQDAQMPAEKTADTEENKLIIPEEAALQMKPAAKVVQLGKANVLEASKLKDKVYNDLAVVVPASGDIQALKPAQSLDRKETESNYYSGTPVQSKSKGSLALDAWGAKKPGAKKAEQASRAVKAAAVPAEKMQAQAASSGMASEGVVVNEPAVAEDEAAAPMEEEAAKEQVTGMGAVPVKESNTGGAFESEAQTYVFKDEKAWKTFAANNGMNEPVKIDWTKQMLVVVISPGKPSTGYSIEITNVEYLANKVIVRYRETAPAQGSISADEAAGPVRAKAVNKSSLPVEFEESK